MTQTQKDRPWLIRTYAGHSTAKASNALYRSNLAKGQTGLSVAFDLPTQTGYDSDHTLARGEVGKVGVPVCHLGDMRTLFDGSPVDRRIVAARAIVDHPEVAGLDDGLGGPAGGADHGLTDLDPLGLRCDDHPDPGTPHDQARGRRAGVGGAALETGPLPGPDGQGLDLDQHLPVTGRGGGYRVEGEVLGGPPPHPLDRYEAEVEDGTLIINFPAVPYHEG